MLKESVHSSVVYIIIFAGSGVHMSYMFFGFGILSVVIGYFVINGASSVMQEIAGGICFLLTAILWSCAALLGKLDTLINVVSGKTIIKTPNSADDLSSVKGEDTAKLKYACEHCGTPLLLRTMKCPSCFK